MMGQGRRRLPNVPATFRKLEQSRATTCFVVLCRMVVRRCSCRVGCLLFVPT